MPLYDPPYREVKKTTEDIFRLKVVGFYYSIVYAAMNYKGHWLKYASIFVGEWTPVTEDEKIIEEIRSFILTPKFHKTIPSPSKRIEICNKRDGDYRNYYIRYRKRGQKSEV